MQWFLKYYLLLFIFLHFLHILVLSIVNDFLLKKDDFTPACCHLPVTEKHATHKPPAVIFEVRGPAGLQGYRFYRMSRGSQFPPQ